MIQLQCPSCSKSYKVKDAAAGKRFECKKCGETVTVPEAKSSGRSSSQSSSGAKRKASAAAPAKKKPKQQPDDFVEDAFVEDAHDDYDDYESYDDDYGDDYDEYESAPKRSSSRKSSSKSKSKGKSKPTAKKKKKKSGGGGALAGLAFGFNLNRINGILTVVGGMLIFFGIQETRLSSMAKDEPTQMTLQELIEKGSPDNIYLTLTDVNCILDETVLYGDEGPGGRITKVDRAWIPATIPGGGMGDVKLIIKCTKASKEHEVAAIASQRTFTGMIINQIDSINREERQLLASGLPGTNLEKAYIFHERRTPSGAGLVILYYVGGLVLIGAGLFWIFLVHPS